MLPEFSIEKVREFVKKGYTSVSARYAKSALQHYDEIAKEEFCYWKKGLLVSCDTGCGRVYNTGNIEYHEGSDCPGCRKKIKRV